MEFSELFTQGVRDVLPVTRRKGLVSYFDCVGASVTVSGRDTALRAGVHRLLLGMVDLLDRGFVMFSAESFAPVEGISRVMVHAAGAGPVAAMTLDGMLRRLALTTIPMTCGTRGDSPAPTGFALRRVRRCSSSMRDPMAWC
jgi:hypothetical protein